VIAEGLLSTGVPNLFGLFPLWHQFAHEKAPNKLDKLGSPPCRDGGRLSCW
jgi:hypothetical protein